MCIEQEPIDHSALQLDLAYGHEPGALTGYGPAITYLLAAWGIEPQTLRERPEEAQAKARAVPLDRLAHRTDATVALAHATVWGSVRPIPISDFPENDEHVLDTGLTRQQILDYYYSFANRLPTPPETPHCLLHLIQLTR